MELDIFTKLDGISVTKENKTNVDYFIFDEFEIHLNKIPPNTKQEWHKHKTIEEVLVVTKGELIVRWKENESIETTTVFKDNIVRVKKSIHTIENHTDEWAEFTVFRMVPSGEDKREIIKRDKVIIDI
ncbi:cupin domain-containing protein [Clostridium intestinale]|uniref:cupin domain-containing protein n=1 Tax=Clostridium intestinale TaxID=36845 RepID=UPI002DD6B832|nr:cupin domain-containing protein [Clostridium intestinale]WRY52272.1 cupin domain-containing protein [Clostridium intestinale]